MEPTAPPASAALLARASRGDRAALGELLARHLPRLRAYVRLRCGPRLRARESSSDIAQSVCRELLEQAGAFEYRGEPQFRAWLFTAAARKIADRAEFWAAGKRDPGRELETPIGSPLQSGDPDGEQQLLDVYRTTLGPSQAALGREALERIEGAFDDLPGDYREAVVLSRVLALPRDEVARRMGRSEDSVRHLLFRGLAQLAQKLEPGRAGGASDRVRSGAPRRAQGAPRLPPPASAP